MYVLTKLFFCGSDVTDTKVFYGFLWLRAKEEVMESRLEWWQSRTMRSVSSPTSTVLLVVAD